MVDVTGRNPVICEFQAIGQEFAIVVVDTEGERKNIAWSSAKRHERKISTLVGSDAGISRKIEYSSLLNSGPVVVGYVEDATAGGGLNVTGGAEKGAGSGLAAADCWRRRASF
jgi:hypothetical protein